LPAAKVRAAPTKRVRVVNVRADEPPPPAVVWTVELPAPTARANIVSVEVALAAPR